MFQFGRFPAYGYVFAVCCMGIPPCGFPHSDIRGSMDVCSYPRLFAAYHVLLRLPVPRHSPCALISLTVFPNSRFYVLPTKEIRFCSFPLYLLSSFIAVALFGFQGTRRALFRELYSRAQPSRSRRASMLRVRGYFNPLSLLIGFWWAQVDSNHRPHAYQACALTG